jgi:hypothetical protein
MALPLVVGGIISSIGVAIARLFSFAAVQYVALKLLLFGIIMVVLPLVIMNVIEWWMVEILDYAEAFIAASDISTDVQGFTIQMTGISAYLADRLQLPAAFGMVMSANIFRITLNFIPGIK